MLFSKTKVFRSVVVLILAISMIGGLVVFKGFALDEDARDSFTISSVAEESSNDDANDVMEITGENAVDAEVNDVMEIVDKSADDAEANDVMEIVDENTDDAQANDVMKITGENTVDADATGIVEVADEEDNEENSENDVENTQENRVCLPGECPENPIIISSVEDLEDFATDLEEGNDFSGKYFEIIDDIIVLKDNKFFSERLNKNGILFTGKFNGHIKSNKGGFVYIYVKEIPRKVFLFEDLGQDAEIYMGFVLLTEEEARIYSFSCS